MNNLQKIQAVKRKTRLRLVFTVLTMGLYFSYIFNYTSAGAFLGDRLGDTSISGSLVMYAGLIVVFIVLELFFLQINRSRDEK